MKALITGGAGFIGYHLAKELVNHGYQVTLVDNFSRGIKDSFLCDLESDEHISCVCVNLLEKDNLKQLNEDFDVIFHLAAIIGVQNVLNHSYEVLENNVKLLLNMMDFAKKQRNLKRFVFASTSEVYAGTLQYYGMEIPTPESTPLTITPLDSPRTSYMLSKIYGETLLQQSDIPFTIVRPHNFYGPRMGMSHVIPELLKKAYFLEDGQKLEVFSVEHKRTFCYISDAVVMLRLLAETESALRRTFNVGNETPEVSMREVAETILKITEKQAEIEAGIVTPGSPERRCPSMKETIKCMGYTSQVSLLEGIQRTFDWYRKYIFDGTEPCAQ